MAPNNAPNALDALSIGFFNSSRRCRDVSWGRRFEVIRAYSRCASFIFNSLILFKYSSDGSYQSHCTINCTCFVSVISSFAPCINWCRGTIWLPFPSLLFLIYSLQSSIVHFSFRNSSGTESRDFGLIVNSICSIFGVESLLYEVTWRDKFRARMPEWSKGLR